MSKDLNVVYHDKKIFSDGIRHHFIIKELNDVFDVIYFNGKNSELFNLGYLSDGETINVHRYLRDDKEEFHSYQYVLEFIRRYLEYNIDDEVEEVESVISDLEREQDEYVNSKVGDIPVQLLGSLSIGEVNDFINDLLGHQTDIYSKFVFIVDGKERGLTSIKFEDGIFHFDAKSLAHIEGEG